MKTVVEGEDVLCRPREPKEGQDQLMIKKLFGGVYWDLLDPVTCASTDVFVVVFFRSPTGLANLDSGNEHSSVSVYRSKRSQSGIF